LAIVNKAIVEKAGGLVRNVAAFEDEVTDFSPFCPDDCEIIDAVYPAQPGAMWDGSQFIAPVIPESSRLDVMMGQELTTQIYDAATDAMVDRPAEDIAADKAELLGYLHSKLADTGDLSWEEMNKMLALERES